uniref:TGF-beta family profile domain-containing protein n=1 Tax=Ciona savignyi TaxID=51511 RepID=H2Z6V2_CIOSA
CGCKIGYKQSSHVKLSERREKRYLYKNVRPSGCETSTGKESKILDIGRHRLEKSAVPPIFIVFTIFLILFMNVFHSDAYVMAQEGTTQSHLYRRLAGRERRELQREILSLLGLTHRPNPTNHVFRTSAPMYMLGLYNSASDATPSDGMDIDPMRNLLAGDGEVTGGNVRSNRHTFNRRSASAVRLNHRLSGHMDQHTEESWIFNEVGVFEESSDQMRSPQDFNAAGGTYDSLATNGVERRLLDDSDLVMSFVNTKQPRGEADFSPAELRRILKRFRSFYFNMGRVSDNEQLTAAKFRLYKERSDDVMGNQTIRVNVYQAMLDPAGSPSVYLLGSRLVGSFEEGWLVYDVTSAVRDWIVTGNNMGLKITVENIDGNSYMKPQRVGVVGRRGEAAKQAFLVAFFAQGEDSLHEQLRRRVKRSPPIDEEFDEEEDWTDGHLLYADDSEVNATETNNRTWRYPSTEAPNTEEEDERPNATSNTVEGDGDAHVERERTMIRRRTRRRKKKSRKKKNKVPSRRKKPEPCHRKRLHVSFRDLGWESFVLAPPDYAAYRCSGGCAFPLNAHTNATNHAIIQSLVSTVVSTSTVPMPCCSPTKLLSLAFLYQDEAQNVLYKKFKDMVVLSCGCK